MISRIYRILTRPLSIFGVLLVATLLSLEDRNLGYFFGLGVVLFIVWRNQWDWSMFGFGRRINLKMVLVAMLLAVLMFLALGVIEAFLQIHFGEPDLSSLDDIRGDTGNYIFIMLIMWIFAAFGEELLFLGYYTQGFAKLFGNSKKSWIIWIIIMSTYFGISHVYQGPAGAITVGLGSIFLSTLFYKQRNNLLLVVLIHGFYDTIGLTLIYVDKYMVLSNWVKSMVST